MSKLAAFAGVVALATSALAQSTAAQWGQCGGQGWTGATLCPTGWYCAVGNQYYSQCLQGSTTATSTTSTTTSTTTTTTTTSTGTGSSSTTGTSTSTGVGPGSTLIGSNVWLRAVTDPNFHTYIQSSPVYTASGAVLGSYTTAAQFQIVNGQLVQYLASGQLYGYVEPRADSTVVKLRLSFVATAPNTTTAGTFSWSGDALLWTIPTITRPNTAAMLGCPNSAGAIEVYVNLGAYGYMTPAGCSDHTYNYYNGATAVGP